jgi:copper(I)-binding protein
MLQSSFGRIPALLSALLLVALALLAGGAPAQAHEYKVGALTVVHPWARPSAAQTGAAYFVIRNEGKEDDALLRIETDVARTVQVHEMKMEGTIMRMRAVDRLVVPAGGSVALTPGGLHVMLIGLKAPLKDGDKFPMKLVFEKAGAVDVSTYVQTPEEMRKDDHGSGAGGGMGNMPGMEMH